MAENKQQFSVQRIYIKDLSFESPQSPAVFAENWKPQVKVDLNTRSTGIENGSAEVVLTVTITASLEEKTAFLIEVQQAGLFAIAGFEEEQARQLLAIACPNLLFPYLREAVDSLVVKGGFPPINLQPVNFEALYLQAKQQAEKEASAATTH